MTAVSSNTAVANRIEWADVYFTASADKEPFEDVEIVTAKNSYLDLAFIAAADIVMKGHTNGAPAIDDVHRLAKIIMDDHKIFVQEHVEVSAERISICINALTVDDDVVWRALDMLAVALEQLDGGAGTVYFGEKLRFSSSEIAWGTTH